MFWGYTDKGDEAMPNNYIHFVWAMKRLLRDKANYVVLEGFLSTLLKEDIRINKFLESEGNQNDSVDKFNRVDMLAEDTNGELLIIEIQNNRELDYFHRMLYGVSKAITDYIGLGDAYSNVRKVYSINIVYFDLGQGKDYVYHGKTFFRGLHVPEDVLQLSVRQKELFVGKEAGDIFPEYYVLKVNEFDQIARTPLDEWVRFLKTGEIKNTDTAKGLPEARERLRIDRLNEKEKQSYYRDMEAIRYQKSVITTGWIEGKAEGRAEGREEGKIEGAKMKQFEIARKLKSAGVPINTIIQTTGLSEEEIP